MKKRKLIIATGNKHKVAEFETLLKGLDFEVRAATDCGGMPEVEENAADFAGNAWIKADALQDRVPEGAWILADDSGLEVDALGGAPGVLSARYAGEGASDRENVEKLLAELQAVPMEKRRARFRCVLSVIDDEGRVSFHEGTCEGRIAERTAGSEGFGYDPVFVPEGYSQSFAELGESIKGRLSHRAKAVADLRDYLNPDDEEE